MTDQNPQDPSMEDILASIRRILSEDEEAGGDDVPASPDNAEVVAEEQEEVAVEEPEYEEVIEEVYEEVPEEFVEEVVEEIVQDAFENEPEEVLELTDNMAYQPDTDDSLISQPVANAAVCSLAQLAKAISEDRNLALGGQGLTLEELVRQMLKPFIKEWLDANLPYVVERLVKKEIERVVEKASR